LRALARERVLLATSFSASVAAFGWGLMLIGFPLYAVIGLTGFLEGAGVFGRDRPAPAPLATRGQAQVLTTVSGFSGLAIAAGGGGGPRGPRPAGADRRLHRRQPNRGGRGAHAGRKRPASPHASAMTTS